MQALAIATTCSHFFRKIINRLVVLGSVEAFPLMVDLLLSIQIPTSVLGSSYRPSLIPRPRSDREKGMCSRYLKGSRRLQIHMLYDATYKLSTYTINKIRGISPELD